MTKSKHHYLVVGGTSGIGAATVSRLTSVHSVVIFCGRKEEEGRALAQRLGRSGGRVLFQRADVTSAEEVERLFDFVEGELGHLDGAFNAAGVVGRDTPLRGVRFHDSEEQNFDSVFDVNVKGLWRCLKRELALMHKQKRGSIVNCASVAGLRCADSMSVSYTASKHAVVGITRATAVEYAPFNVRINAVCPGVIQTPMLNGLEAELLKDLQKKNKSARIGSADEVAAVVSFLLSDESSYMNGAVIPIDAGGLCGAL